MLKFAARRLLYMLILVCAVAVLGFVVIQLPPGDWLSHLHPAGGAERDRVDQQQVETLKRMYGLDRPMIAPVPEVGVGHAARQLRLLVLLEPPGGRSGHRAARLHPADQRHHHRVQLRGGDCHRRLLATRQYGIGDYLATVFGFLGLSTPPFLVALVLVYLLLVIFNVNVVGAVLARLPESRLVVGARPRHAGAPAGAGAGDRSGRHRRPAAHHARHPAGRAAQTVRDHGARQGGGGDPAAVQVPGAGGDHPIVSTVAWVFPELVSGGAIVAVVLNLPTMGPLLLSSLRGQDMFLAGAIMTLLSMMTVVGFFLSDLLLMLIDPRIRMD